MVVESRPTVVLTALPRMASRNPRRCISHPLSSVPLRYPHEGYGLWSLVIIKSLVFIIFAFSFTKPKTPRDWRPFGMFSAFIDALFNEMYGFPLVI